MLDDVRVDEDNTIFVKGVGGIVKLNKVGVLPGFGKVHVLDTNNRVNILSLCLVMDKFPVSLVNGVFEVIIRDGLTIKFERMGNDLWGCDFGNLIQSLKCPDENTNKSMMCETVASRESQYTTEEVKRAKKAREVMKQLGYPSTKDMVKMIVKGMIINMPITVHDIIRANKIYGPDVASLKGKTVKRNLKKTSNIYVPRAMMKRQDLYTDIFYWRGIGFMLSIARPLRIKFVTVLSNKETGRYLKTIIEGHIGRMTDHGFDIRTIYVDPQRALNTLKGKLGCTVDTSGARQHVKVIERHIRTVKERLRATECGLPYKCPKRMIKGMVYSVVTRLNMFPSGDQRDSISPREMYTGIKADYKRDVRGLSFGEYVQAHEDYDQNTNLPRERTRGCIALYPKGNAGGSWKFYSLKTNMEITRDNWTILPIPDIVIDRVNAIYEADERVDSIILPDYNEDEKKIIQESGGIEGLLEPEYVNEVPQLDQNGVEFEDDRDIVDNGHEEEHIENMDKKGRAMEAIKRLFSNNEDQDNIQEDISEHPVCIDDNIKDEHDDKATDSTQYMGSINIDGIRKSGRIYNRTYINMMQRRRKVKIVRRVNRDNYVLAMTRTQAYKKFATEAEKAAIKELSQIYDRGTLHIIDKKMMSLSQMRKLIRSAMIFDDKYDVNGNFERLKARLVARGNEMDESLYEDRSSPTISTIHVMIILALAAKERRHIRVVDIGNAFLEAEMKSGEDVYVELDEVSSRLLGMIDNSIRPMIGENGKIVARLDKALYGCIQSAKLWFDKLTLVLSEYDFVTNPCDGCVINKMVNGKQITVGFHVDDLLITCEDDNIIDDVIKHLGTKFKEVKEKNDSTMGYLGMRMEIKGEGIYLDMDVYTKKILDDFGTVGSAPTPSTEDLFNDRDVIILDNDSRKRFHSCVAKLLYLAKRTRPDILLTVSHLASRVSIANEDDQNKLQRLLRYLNKHTSMKLFFSNDADLTLRAYIDASFAIHADGTSRTGMIIVFGGASICAWTSKQKMTTKSACESELVGVSDGSSEVLGCREFLIHQGYHMEPAIIYQDNTSVIDLIKAGRPTSHRTRHLKARYFFLKDYIKEGEVEIRHMGTDWMLADYLTKPLGGEKFIRFRDSILGLVDSG